MSEPIVLHVSRARAASRAVLCSVPAVLLTLTTVLIYSRLNLVPTGISNRLVEYSIAAISLPAPLLALWTALRTLRWLLLALWPARLAVVADARALTFHLGPFRHRSYDALRLEVRYPFEMSQDDDGGGFEAFLPEDEQRAKLLPRILHPQAREPLNRLILRFAKGTEQEIVRAMRPAIDRWHPYDESHS